MSDAYVTKAPPGFSYQLDSFIQVPLLENRTVPMYRLVSDSPNGSLVKQNGQVCDDPDLGYVYPSDHPDAPPEPFSPFRAMVGHRCLSVTLPAVMICPECGEWSLLQADEEGIAISTGSVEGFAPMTLEAALENLGATAMYAAKEIEQLREGVQDKDLRMSLYRLREAFVRADEWAVAGYRRAVDLGL